MFMLQCLLPMLALGLYPKAMTLPDYRLVQVTWLAAMSMCAGHLVYGLLGDRAGRRPTFWWNTAMMAAALIIAPCASVGSSGCSVPSTAAVCCCCCCCHVVLLLL
jgi:MFS family permease